MLVLFFLKLISNLTELRIRFHMFLVFPPGGAGVVGALSVPGGDRWPAAICSQHCLQPPAHSASGHHGSRAANPPVL